MAFFSDFVSGAVSGAAGAPADGAAAGGFFTLSFADAAAFFRAGAEGFGGGAAGFSESRCSMFFKPLRIDFFCAMRDFEKGLSGVILLQRTRCSAGRMNR